MKVKQSMSDDNLKDTAGGSPGSSTRSNSSSEGRSRSPSKFKHPPKLISKKLKSHSKKNFNDTLIDGFNLFIIFIFTRKSNILLFCLKVNKLDLDSDGASEINQPKKEETLVTYENDKVLSFFLSFFLKKKQKKKIHSFERSS